MNALLLILHCIPISIPPSTECNSAMYFLSLIKVTSRYLLPLSRPEQLPCGSITNCIQHVALSTCQLMIKTPYEMILRFPICKIGARVISANSCSSLISWKDAWKSFHFRQNFSELISYSAGCLDFITNT